MNSYGHIDRLIEPFYQRDLAAGRITQEEAYFLLQCFLCKTDLHCHFNEKRKTYDNGVTVMIGGCDFDGVPVYNSITDMVLQSYAENRLINPKLNARASSQSPLAYLEKLTLLLQSGNNNLVIENDDYIIPMFQRMGVSLKDARSYVGNGCQEVICPNQLHSRAFVYLNMVQVLLDTMQYTKENLPEGLYKIYQYGSFEKRSFDDLFTSFLSNLRSYIKVIAAEFAPYESIHQQINPEPMLSAFNADCIGRGCDIADGGALYCHKTLSLVGFGTLCDSLLSLRRSYQSGTEHILFSAIASDFQEYETLRESLLSCEDRFGHSEDADTFAGYLAHALAKISHGITNAQGIEWHTSLFTYYMFSSFGKRTGATPDGRHGGAPLSRQMNMASLPVLTAAANSMSVLAEANFHDVGIFDIALPYTASANENVRHALTSYLRVCIDLKLPVLQINIGDVQTLIEERQHKGTHPGLTVRVCGYSALFGELSTDMQDEIIARWHTKSLLNPDKSFIM